MYAGMDTLFKISSTVLDEANDTFEKLCEMAGDRTKIKTNHAWMRPKRGGDSRAYTGLILRLLGQKMQNIDKHIKQPNDREI